MNRRARLALLGVALVLAAVLVTGIWFFQSPAPKDSPEAIYNQRFDRGYPQAIAQLRQWHHRNRSDPATRYWLASLLIEDAKDQKAIAESLQLLQHPENAPPLGWISNWSEARALQAYGRGLELLAAEGAPLQREMNLPNGDAQLKQFVSDALTSLDRLDGKLRPMRNATEGPVPKKPMLTGDEVREDLLALKNLLTQRWAYVIEKEAQTGTSLDALLVEGLAKVQPQMTLKEATDLLNGFVASLQDGHTHLGYDSPRFSLPFRVIEAAEGLIIAQTAKPGLGIEVGDRLISVEGESAMAAVEARQQMAIASTRASRRAAAVRFLQARWGEDRSYQVSVEHHGKVITAEIKTSLTDEMPWSAAPQNGKPNSWITTRPLAPDFAYMKVSTWWPPTQSGPMDEDRLAKHRLEIDQAVAEVKAATDLVLDLRNNAGGSDALCTYLASYFVPDPMKTYVLRYRIPPGQALPPGSDGFENAERKEANYPRQSGPVLKIKLWVLMDEGCYSATDTLLNVFTRNIPDRVTTIGRSNGAGIGGPNVVGTLRNSGLPLTCSTCKAYSTDGDLLEGQPVKVNHWVKWTQADIVAGKDADLEAALKLIGSPPTLAQ